MGREALGARNRGLYMYVYIYIYIYMSDWWNTVERVLLGTADSLKLYLLFRTVNMYVQACCAMTHRQAT